MQSIGMKAREIVEHLKRYGSGYCIDLDVTALMSRLH